MFTTSPQPDTLLDVEADAQHLLLALREASEAGRPTPTLQQAALTLRALADFPLCMRILPQSAYRRLGAPATGVSRYLAGFARHLARHEQYLTYDPEYWILGAPVTERLMAKIAARATGEDAPTPAQAAALLLALADTEQLVLPARVVEVAGDGDLPWNGATGIGLWFHRLADALAPAVS